MEYKYEGHSIKSGEFCRVHDLQQGNLNKVLLGKRKSHKGWHLPDNSL
jgi:hypothetical protein